MGKPSGSLGKKAGAGDKPSDKPGEKGCKEYKGDEECPETCMKKKGKCLPVKCKAFKGDKLNDCSVLGPEKCKKMTKVCKETGDGKCRNMTPVEIKAAKKDKKAKKGKGDKDE